MLSIVKDILCLGLPPLWRWAKPRVEQCLSKSARDSRRRSKSLEGAHLYCKPLHLEAIHRVRRLKAGLAATDESWDSRIRELPEFCTAARSVMGRALGLGEEALHCCIKAFPESAAPESAARQSNLGDLEVATLGRSLPSDGRPNEQWPADPHLVKKNTVFASLLGAAVEPEGGGGLYQWKRFNAFSCNDLMRWNDEGWFHCSRHDWKQFYRSALVYPIRVVYYSNLTLNKPTVVGFLAFDCPRTDGFAGLPDIFQYMNDPTKYERKLRDCPVFHLGAILADVLAIALYDAQLPKRPCLEQEKL